MIIISGVAGIPGLFVVRYAEGCSVYVGGLDGEDEMYPEQFLGVQDGR